MTAAVLVAAVPLYAPQLLAFPYRSGIGPYQVWSEVPLDGIRIRAAFQLANAKVKRSPLARASEPRRVFVTQGGWRWHWLAVSSSGSFAITRPLGTAIVVNHTDPAGAIVRNARAVVKGRTLASIIAHETTHGMIRRRFGFYADRIYPTWLTEGYCDFVAGESTLSSTDVARLSAAGTDHPALVYYHGRRKVTAILASNGGSVERMFAKAR